MFSIFQYKLCMLLIYFVFVRSFIDGFGSMVYAIVYCGINNTMHMYSYHIILYMTKLSNLDIYFLKIGVNNLSSYESPMKNYSFKYF